MEESATPVRLRFRNAAFALSVGFIVAQQIVVASSTLFIAKLGKAVASGTDYSAWLVLFIGSLLLALVPTVVWNYFLTTAKYSALDDYVAAVRQTLFNQPQLYFSERFKTERQSYFTHDAWIVVQDTYDFWADFISTGVNVLLTSVVLGLVLSYEFAVAYAAALALTFVAFRIGRKTIERRSEAAQDDRNGMLQLLAQGLDCILLGNAWNDFVWTRQFSQRSKRAKIGSRRAQLAIDGVSLLTTLSSMIPILMTIGWAFSKSAGNPGALGVLVATLPRQVTTVQYLGQVVFYGAHWTDVRTRIRGIEKSADLPESVEPYGGTISWGNLRLEDDLGATSVVGEYDDLGAATHAFGAGRYTLRGGNGTGKTTLLSRLKAELGDRAFLLPAHEKLAFEWKSSRESSTGLGLLENLDEIARVATQGTASVLLLDEWDANLDAENLASASHLLDTLKTRMCVVEVRHRS